MTDIDALASELVTAMRPVLEKFVSNTRAEAERVTADRVKAAVGQFLAGLNTDHIAPVFPATADQLDRVMPGTVKPAIRKFMADLGGAGMTVKEIVGATGFKFNSVRGTLWQLAKEEAVELREGKYYAKSGAASAETEKPAP